MYIPRSNAENRPEVLVAFMRAHPFATLVSVGASGELCATHLPVVVDPTRGVHGVIEGHVARANSHHTLVRAAEDLVTASRESLVIFTGPDAYVTPTWYPSKAVHGQVVPTWNYAAVHAYGNITWHEDPSWLLAHVSRLTTQSEANRTDRWNVSDAPEDYVARELKAIVGFELQITRTEGKWKMSQNRSREDIDGVVDGLSGSDHALDRVVGAMVAERRPNRP